MPSDVKKDKKIKEIKVKTFYVILDGTKCYVYDEMFDRIIRGGSQLGYAKSKNLVQQNIIGQIKQQIGGITDAKKEKLSIAEIKKLQKQSGLNFLWYKVDKTRGLKPMANLTEINKMKPSKLKKVSPAFFKKYNLRSLIFYRIQMGGISILFDQRFGSPIFSDLDAKMDIYISNLPSRSSVHTFEKNQTGLKWKYSTNPGGESVKQTDADRNDKLKKRTEESSAKK
jgi:hypothetical protein